MKLASITTRLLAPVLLGAMCLGPVRPVVQLLVFEINRDYIAGNLCVNRANPRSCCKGACVLKQQLTEETKRTNQPAAPTQLPEQPACWPLPVVVVPAAPLAPHPAFGVWQAGLPSEAYVLIIGPPPRA